MIKVTIESKDGKEIVHYESNFSDNIQISISKPKGWGEGYALGLALDILTERYFQIYDKQYKKT